MPTEAPQTAPPPPPFETPEGVSPDAYPAFKRMLKECGKTVFRMPTSCELFLRQHLSPFPAERDLLLAALRRGVPDRVTAHPGRDGFDDFLADTAAALARDAGLAPPQAKWAVEAWATGLGRPPGYVAPPVVARVVEPPPAHGKPAVSDKSLRRIMAGIAAAGGFLGGMLGNAARPLAFLVATAAAGEAADVRLYLLTAAAMLAGAVGGGLGAAAGWWMGRGDEWPWAGFAAACGAAFGTGLLVGPGFASAVVIALAAFGAAFTAATRGGNRT